VLNSALQGSVVARAGRQMQDDEEPRSDEQSKEENSHSVFRIESSAGRRLTAELAGPSSQTRDNGHINVSAQRESGASANQNLANSRPNRALFEPGSYFSTSLPARGPRRPVSSCRSRLESGHLNRGCHPLNKGEFASWPQGHPIPPSRSVRGQNRPAKCRGAGASFELLDLFRYLTGLERLSSCSVPSYNPNLRVVPPVQLHRGWQP